MRRAGSLLAPLAVRLAGGSEVLLIYSQRQPAIALTPQNSAVDAFCCVGRATTVSPQTRATQHRQSCVPAEPPAAGAISSTASTACVASALNALLRRSEAAAAASPAGWGSGWQPRLSGLHSSSAGCSTSGGGDADEGDKPKRARRATAVSGERRGDGTAAATVRMQQRPFALCTSNPHAPPPPPPCNPPSCKHPYANPHASRRAPARRAAAPRRAAPRWRTSRS
jgi:hypothetical protein